MSQVGAQPKLGKGNDMAIRWELLDENPATVSIVAAFSAANNLYQLHNNGGIWRYTGPPVTGWERLDQNPATKQIAAAGNNLYQIHNNGRIWRYTGPPVTGWELLDNNPASVSIVAAGDKLYQLHHNGGIRRETLPAVPRWGGVGDNPIGSWELLDNNPASVTITAAGDNLYQLHRDGRIRRASFGSAQLGRWDPVFELPNVALHTHVLPNEKVLFWGRRDHPTGSMHEHECTPFVWDPTTGQLTPTPQPTRADGTKVNLFCSGHAFLPDGRLLVAGGHLTDGDGLNQACIYDYRTNTWTALPVMNQRRWYPTATTLADGTVLVSSGSYIENGMTIINDVPQIWDGHQWKSTASFIGLPLYPRMHVASNGQVFMSGPNDETYLLDAEGAGTWIPLPEPGGLRRNGER